MSEIKSKIVSSVFWLGGANAFSQVITWVFTILVARLLSPADYGLVAMASVYVAFAEYLNEFGVGAALVQKKELNSDEISGIYSVSIAMSFIFVIVSFPAAHLMSLFFKEERLVYIVYALSSTFLISAIKNVQQNLMIRDMRFKEIAQIETVARITNSAIAYGCALYGMGAWTLVVQYLSYNAIQALLYAYYEKQLPGRVKSFRQIRAILKFGFEVMSARVIGVLSQRTDSLVIGRLIGSEMLGVYSYALSLANKPMDKIMSVLNQVMLPVLSRVQHEDEKLRRYFLKMIEMELLILLPIFVVFALSVNLLVPLLLGDKWIKLIVPLQIFSLGGVFSYLSSVSSMVVLAKGSPRILVYFGIAGLIMTPSLMITLGLYLGFNGILISWAVLTPLFALALFGVTIKLIGLDAASVVRSFRLPVALTAVMTVCLLVFQKFIIVQGWAGLISTLLVGAAAYVSAMWFMDRAKMLEVISIVRNRRLEAAG